MARVRTTNVSSHTQSLRETGCDLGERFGTHPLSVSSSAGLTSTESEIAADLLRGS